MKIAVFVPSRPHFGNILTQFPFFCALKDKYPNANVTVWTKHDESQLLIKNQLVEKVVNYKKESTLKLISRVRRQGYDMVYNLYSRSDRVHLAVGLSGAKYKYGHSESKFYRGLYTELKHILKGDQYIANTHLYLLNNDDNQYTPKIIKTLSSGKNDFNQVNIVPCGGAGSYKKWNIDNYIKLAELIVDNTSSVEKVNFILGDSEKNVIDIIPESYKGIVFSKVVNPSVTELIDLAEQSIITIGNDCGPIHIFQMSETPLITLWGWKNEFSSPHGTMTEWFYSHENSWPLVPNESEKNINGISVNKVLCAVLAQLNRNALQI